MQSTLIFSERGSTEKSASQPIAQMHGARAENVGDLQSGAVANIIDVEPRVLFSRHYRHADAFRVVQLTQVLHQVLQGIPLT